MTLTLNLPADTERRLTELAAKSGATLESYVKQVLEREVRDTRGMAQGPTLEVTEFERSLDELAEGLPPLPALPADWSRADIYGEHP